MRACLAGLTLWFGLSVAVPAQSNGNNTAPAAASAAAPGAAAITPSLDDCLCQCNSITFVANGVVNGNCLTYDNTGLAWCYVANAVAGFLRGGCLDEKHSTRFQGATVSYRACITPMATTSVCRFLLSSLNSNALLKIGEPMY